MDHLVVFTRCLLVNFSTFVHDAPYLTHFPITISFLLSASLILRLEVNVRRATVLGDLSLAGARKLTHTTVFVGFTELFEISFPRPPSQNDRVVDCGAIVQVRLTAPQYCFRYSVA